MTVNQSYPFPRAADCRLYILPGRILQRADGASAPSAAACPLRAVGTRGRRNQRNTGGGNTGSPPDAKRHPEDPRFPPVLRRGSQRSHPRRVPHGGKEAQGSERVSPQAETELSRLCNDDGAWIRPAIIMTGPTAQTDGLYSSPSVDASSSSCSVRAMEIT